MVPLFRDTYYGATKVLSVTKYVPICTFVLVVQSCQIITKSFPLFASFRAKPDPASSSVPTFDRTQKPGSAPPQGKDYGVTDYLRPVVIPAQLLSSFLILAQKNTDKNIETCGILAGRLVCWNLN